MARPAPARECGRCHFGAPGFCLAGGRGAECSMSTGLRGARPGGHSVNIGLRATGRGGCSTNLGLRGARFGRCSVDTGFRGARFGPCSVNTGFRDPRGFDLQPRGSLLAARRPICSPEGAFWGSPARPDARPHEIRGCFYSKASGNVLAGRFRPKIGAFCTECPAFRPRTCAQAPDPGASRGPCSLDFPAV